MYQILVHLHSVGRWIVLLLLLIAIFRSATAGNRPYEKADNTVGLLLTIFADTMLLIGLVLWFISPAWGYHSLTANSFGEVMKNPPARFFAVEHNLGMIVGIALIHVGKAQGKKSLPDRTKHRRMMWFYLIALLIILISVPWPFRVAGAGRGWF